MSTWLTSGGRPVAALLAGGLGTWIGVRPTLVAGTCLLLVPLAVLHHSPLRGLLDMPGSHAVASPSAEAVTPATPSGPTVPHRAVAVDVPHDHASEGGP
ncbi:hypothetical protein [Streptomyces eurythermus]|uniref:hypothetical protein n=1 Tax=Streptomyces eurythermus TaxID=42237 RepID=UPI0033D38261